MNHHSGFEHGYEDSYSHLPRSSTSIAISTVERIFRTSHPIDSPYRLSFKQNQLAASQEIRPSSYTSYSPHRSTPLTARTSYHPSLSSRRTLDAEWSAKRSQFLATPSTQLGPARGSSPSPSPNQNPATATMSTVAVAFDPRMEMGIPRSSFTWPGLDSSPDLLGHDMSSVGHSSTASMTPPSGSRSLTSSPPRFTLTPEQRELKRQRDQARRDSKTSARARRAMSTYSSASQSPPVSMHEFSSASPVPVYTTAPAQISLLAEPATTMAGSYMSSYSTSPLPDHSHSPMFTPQFSPMPHGDYMGLNYSPGYPPPPSAHSLSSQYSRPSPPMHDSGMMYPVQAPPVLSSGSAVSQEAGHVRVVQSRPKPQCWDHGCNGRQFSTFSNLLRHQREKSGQAAKATCPNCGAEFTRTTARNGHLLHDKCKQRRNS
ncbi:hypothetical protein GGS23DRAFT_592420 [Durotheca rogersii]|uniref:uncharacterized protein n=1 Tax=Durotheca rogersii TaxID=419775 RepID=UPI002220D999|nr:uncharacterized protein GGS23DRAFT_592420 [Durotheca rogersii]KAI5868663.1 hypothetical protein GGS23DRAFT_592420 [Durotheca rogersii]